MTHVDVHDTTSRRPATIITEPVIGAHEDTRWLDLARVIAMVAVVVVHVIAPVVTGRWAIEGSPGWWTANVLDSAARWCVPVFVMVSGALLLDPRRTERPRCFYRKRLARIGVPLVVWTLAYLAFRRLWFGQDLGLRDAGRDILVGSPFLQLYFLFVLAGLYVIAPFLRVVIRHTTRRMQAGFAGVLLAIGAFDHAAAALAGAGRPTAATQFLPFAGFFVAGWLLRDLPLTRRRIQAAALGFCGSVAATAIVVGLVSTPDGWGAGGRYLYGFLSPTVVVMSLAAFVLFRAAGRHLGARQAWLSAAAVLTFGIFLVHPLVLFPLQSWWQLPSRALLLVGGIAVQVVVTLASSAALTALLQRIPYVRASVG